jgi:hypothetical protein
MPIVPDDKSWTWVLERPCPDCGFVAETFDPHDAPATIRANAGVWRVLLEHPQARRRPNDHQWSAVEYACHVRDVLRLYLVRLHLMLAEDGPEFANWDQDQAAVEGRYDLQEPAVVTAELEGAAERLATAFASVGDDQWGRTGFRSDGAAFTIGSFTRYMVHDPVHHVWDVQQGYAELARS